MIRPIVRRSGVLLLKRGKTMKSRQRLSIRPLKRLHGYDEGSGNAEGVKPLFVSIFCSKVINDPQPARRNQLKAIQADGPPPLATYTYDLNGNRT